MKISCNGNTRDALLNFCCLLYLISRLICSEWINTCVPTLSMKKHLFRSFAFNEFIHPGLPNSAKPCLPFAVSRHEILACFDFLPTRLRHGFVEGKSNRTKASMRQAYSYRNHRHLRLRILVEVSA